MFFDYFDEFVKEMVDWKNWTTSTYKKFGTVKNHLWDFNPKLSFSYLNEKGLTNYVEFLRSVPEMRNSTIEKQIGFFEMVFEMGKI